MALMAVLLLAFGMVALAAPGAEAATRSTQTVVSLTFDDGDADQMIAAKMMAGDHMAGTFYIITGAVGDPEYLTLDNIRQIYASGNEIGGHTVSHVDLTEVSTDEARRQICGGRNILEGWGFQPTSFAYPDGATNPAVEQIAHDCGFNSARLDGGLSSAACPGCGTAAVTSLPPRDPYAIATPSQVDSTWSLATLEDTVTKAEKTGGWVPLVFHHVCENGEACGPLSVDSSILSAFLTWLGDRAGQGTVVKTVGEVMGGASAPQVSAAAAAPHGVVNAGMSQDGPSGLGDSETPGAPRINDLYCWTQTGYGANTVRWQRVPGGHDGPWAEQLTMTSHSSGDAKLLPQLDLGQCAPPATAGRSYQLTTWYESTVNTQFSVYYRTPTGRWQYWISSPFFAPSGMWSKASWQTPALPADASAISFGLAVSAVGTLTTDDYALSAVPVAPAAKTSVGPAWLPGGLPLDLLALICATIIVFVIYTVRRRSVRAARERKAQIATPETEAPPPVESSSSSR